MSIGVAGEVDDLEIDDEGNIAVSWHTEDFDLRVVTGGIEVVRPDGTLLSRFEAPMTHFESIAFDSNGRLFARGSEVDGDDVHEWIRRYALDGTIEWNDDEPDGRRYYPPRVIFVDAADHLLAYDWDCNMDEACPGTLAKYGPDGTLIWERTFESGRSERHALGQAADGSLLLAMVDGGGDYFDTRLKKLAPDGTELGETTIPGLIDQTWATSSGGLAVATLQFAGPLGVRFTELDAAGSIRSSVVRATEPGDQFLRALGPSPDEDGFYALSAAVQRVDGELGEVWSAEPFPVGAGRRRGALSSEGAIAVAWAQDSHLVIEQYVD